jgi:hypothetical protein
MPWSSRTLALQIATIFIFVVGHSHPARAENISQPAGTNTSLYTLTFSGYAGGAVEEWLKVRNYRFERDAKDPGLLGLAIADRVLTIEEKGRMSGLILNTSVKLEKVHKIRITWGVKKYPEEVSYQKKVNNEALMIYIFFGTDKISSGHLLIPNSPYFVGLFLCQHEQLNFPYKGRYFHESGRFVCVGKPAAGQMIVSEFDLDGNFKSYFGKKKTPGITAIGLGFDTSKAGADGTAGAFIQSIEFLEQPADATPDIH